ncbi:MAG: FHA domain-containing protein [Planctomycetia bacterium]|nr:FHA domain-containing protein [Planctomycetia bacterium]
MSSPAPAVIPGAAKAKLQVLRGIRAGRTYGIKEGGVTYIGRQGAAPVDVNLNDHEQSKVPVKQNRFVLVYFDKAGLGLAFTGEPVGAFLNRAPIAPGKRFPLKGDDLVQVGNVVFQVKVIAKKRTGVQK